ncbi:MAG: hypothetical protein ILM98_14140 [Kiritimatiellae bacterium]|jgi:hypothetical protein|nr:hypothetical protein [Kiritimatiellia bacterium]
MSNQENGAIKQLKLRIPMPMFQQLVKDAAQHAEPPATRARHILGDALMDVELTDADKAEIKRLIAENWAKIRGEK